MALKAKERDLKLKLSRLTALMDARGAEALRVTRAGNLAWLTGGNFLVYERGGPVAEGLVHGDSLTIITNAVEAQRLRDEELPEGVAVEAYPWYEGGGQEGIVKRLIGEARVVTDDELDLYEARTPLLESERASFKSLGAEASATVTDALTALEPGLDERQVAARVRFALEREGLACPVLLVAGAARLGRYRHPLPKGAPFGGVGLVVVCAERGGLVVSLSRMLAFGEVPERNRERLGQVLEVERAMWDASQAGTPSFAVLKAAQDGYARVGHPEAWQEHHQGGPAGYFPRDFLITPTEARPVQDGVAYAWNPSLPHAKSEDTILVTGGGLDNLTHDPRWPSLEVGGRSRPDILVL
jgi:Xaa-Pro aminopeptidase